MRVLIVLVVSVVAFVAIGGAAGANGEPKRAITKGDQARAKRVLIVRSDLGEGFRAVRRVEAPLPDEPSCDPLDESDLTVTGHAESPDFTLRSSSAFATIGSTAQVYRTVGQANSSWKRGTGATAAACLAALVRRAAAPGQQVKIVSSKLVPFTKVAPKTVAFRLVTTLTVGGVTVKVYFDAVVMQAGRVQAGLILTSVGRPIPRAETTALAGVLASRLTKAAAGTSGPTA